MNGGTVSATRLNVSSTGLPGQLSIKSTLAPTAELGNVSGFRNVKITPASGGVDIGDSARITVSGDLVIQSSQAINIGNDVSISTHGGSIFLAGASGITGGTGNSFYAESTKGGAIQLSSGPKPTNRLAFGLSRAPGTSVSEASLGTAVDINNDGGVILLNTSGSGEVNLSTSGAHNATLDLTGGAIIFEAKGSNIELDGGNFRTEKLRPIAYSVPRAPNADNFANLGSSFLHASTNMIIETGAAQIHVKKGALLVLEADNHKVRIYACSGPGDVRVQVGAESIELAPGKEMVIADHQLSNAPKQQTDGIGRRASSLYKLGSSSFVAMNDFSLVTLIANSEHLRGVKLADTPEKRAILSRITKTAAVLQQLGTAKGPYRMRM
jgi:hypothetical protein